MAYLNVLFPENLPPPIKSVADLFLVLLSIYWEGNLHAMNSEQSHTSFLSLFIHPMSHLISSDTHIADEHLVLNVSSPCNPNRFDFSPYEDFIDMLCGARIYQRDAIEKVCAYLL